MQPTEKDRKAMQARMNLSLSKGPTSLEGKSKSAMNAIKHGLQSERDILAAEDPDAFQRHLDSFFETFTPQTLPEAAIVHRMAKLQWKLSRAVVLQDTLLDIEVDNQTTAAIQNFQHINLDEIKANSFRSLSDKSRSHQCIDAHQSAISREYSRAYATLLQLRAERTRNEIEAEMPITLSKSNAYEEQSVSITTPAPIDNEAGEDILKADR